MDCEDSVLDDERLDELLKLLDVESLELLDDELRLDELDEDELLSELLVETLELLDNEDSVLDDELELPELSDDNELELLSLLLDSVELDDSLLLEDDSEELETDSWISKKSKTCMPYFSGWPFLDL